MYAIGGGMVGVGGVTYLAPSKSKKKPIHNQPKLKSVRASAGD